jgi:poly-gamma-glutamate synthesis protein (capsule biosynthesis protein)
MIWEFSEHIRHTRPMSKILNKTFTVIFSTYFVLQISYLSPGIHIQHREYGAVGTASSSEVSLLPTTVYRALFSDFRTTVNNTLVFTGDIMLARNVEYLIEKNDRQFPYEKISLTSLGERPAIIGNFESAIPELHESTPAFAMRFSVNPDYLDSLHAAGFTHVTLANNHSFDYGEEGYDNARTMLSSHGIQPFGSGESIGKGSVAYLETDIGRVALIGINASEQMPDFLALQRTFAVVSRQSDYQIAVIHWGTEYEKTHTKTQEVIAKALIGYGADLIVGHHPHVVEDVGIVDGVVVFYSLGNFIFDQYFDSEVERGLVVSVSLSETPSINLLPVTSESHHSQPEFLEAESRQQFLEDLAERSTPSLRSEILSGKIKLDALVASSQKNAIMVR